MDWYYQIEGQVLGPVSLVDLQRLAGRGEIGAATPVSSDGQASWQPWSAVDTAASTGAEPSQAACSQCGRWFADDQMLEYGGVRVCAECKPVFLQRLKEGAKIGGALAFGGFWIRFVARLIDGLILGFVTILLYLPMFALVGFSGIDQAQGPDGLLIGVTCVTYILQFAVQALYEIVFLKRYQATPGKMVFGLKVLRPNQEGLTWGRAIGRYFGYLLSSVTLFVGFIIAAFDQEKRALHDHICDTRVVRVT